MSDQHFINIFGKKISTSPIELCNTNFSSHEIFCNFCERKSLRNIFRRIQKVCALYLKECKSKIIFKGKENGCIYQKHEKEVFRKYLNLKLFFIQLIKQKVKKLEQFCVGNI